MDTMGLEAGLRRNQGLLAAISSLAASLLFAAVRSGAGPNDADSALVPAWALSHLGQLAMPEKYLGTGIIVEAVHIHGGWYSDRPPGMILMSLPSQALVDSPSRWGVTITAALLTAFSVWASFKLWGPRAGWLVTIGSPLLYVGGKTLWPETVCIAALLAAFLIVRSGRGLWSLVPLTALMTTCRLPFGLLAASVLVVLLWRRRALWLPVAGGIVGLACLLAYSRSVFGTWSLAGGYPVSHRLAFGSIWVGLISPARGIFWWSPWLLFVRPRRDRQAVILMIAAGYVLASWLLYDAWGGEGFAGYRYALPLAVLAAASAMRPSSRAAGALFDIAAAWSFAVGVTAERLPSSLAAGRRPWVSGLPMTVAVALFVAFLALLALIRLRSAQRRAEPSAQDSVTSPSRRKRTAVS